jgi:FAD synthase
LRDIERFDSAEHLKQQMQQDRAQALAALRRVQSTSSRVFYA